MGLFSVCGATKSLNVSGRCFTGTLTGGGGGGGWGWGAGVVVGWWGGGGADILPGFTTTPNQGPAIDVLVPHDGFLLALGDG